MGIPNPADWTIMLYIAADGALANFAVESLKQLYASASAPGAQNAKEANVVVAAHFSFSDDATNPKPREYIFRKDGSKKKDAGGCSDLSRTRPLPAPVKLSKKTNLSLPGALEEFLKGVYKKCKAKHYALILWGHGPELLFETSGGTPTHSGYTTYITPVQLREVLSTTKPSGGSSLDIVGFDACFMSMLEMACELKDFARFMVASQDDVPDASFPYDNLVELFRQHGKEMAQLIENHVKAEDARNRLGRGAREGLIMEVTKKQEDAERSLREDVQNSLGTAVVDYLSTYLDYAFTQSTGINPVTLAVLDLGKCNALKNKVNSLASALSAAKDEPELSLLLIEARNKSQDYAGGLYVDLYEFCEKLSAQIGKPGKTKKLRAVRDECQGILTELKFPKRGEPPGNSLILVNGEVIIPPVGNPRILVNGEVIRPGVGENSGTLTNSLKSRNHGISIYLPYLTVGQDAKVSQPLVKGGHGSSGVKGFSSMLNGAAAEYLMCARRELILDTESYYARLALAKTGWYDFIAQVWTQALIKEVPADLDYYYSAQQSWINVSRKPINTAKLGPSDAPASPETKSAG